MWKRERQLSKAQRKGWKVIAFQPLTLLIKLEPFQHALAPGIYKPGDKDKDKDDPFKNGKQGQLA
jgi:hypothetical protein